MRHPTLLVVAVWIITAATCAAQGPNAALPPRYRALTKDGRVRLTRILGTPEIQSSAVNAFSADGKRALYVEDLSIGFEDLHLRSRLHVWDVATKSWPREIEIKGKRVDAVRLAADGKTALIASMTKADKGDRLYRSVDVIDLDTGNLTKSLAKVDYYGPLGGLSDAYDCALAPDGLTALTATSDGLKRWDVKTGKVVTAYEKSRRPVPCLAFLPDGKRFLVGYEDGVTLLFDGGKSEPLKSFDDKEKGGGGLLVSRDGKRFATIDRRSFLRVWDIGTGKNLTTWDLSTVKPDGYLTSAMFADDGKTLICTRTNTTFAPNDFGFPTLVAWDVEAKKTLWTKEAHYRGGPPMLVQGDKLMVGGGPDRFDVWSIKDGKLLGSWGGHKAPVSSVAVLANGQILSAGEDGNMITWRNGQGAKRESPHGGVSAFAINKDRKQWLSAGNDLVIRQWPFDAKRPAFPKKHTGPITSLAFSSDSQWAYSGSNDRSVKTWNLLTGQEIATITGHSEGINAVAISPDDRWIASGSDDTNIRVWPIKAGKLDPDREPILLEKHKKPVTCLTFTPDGKRLISGGHDQTLMVWDLAKKSMDFMIPVHKNWITSLILLDAKTVVTCSDDLSLCVWDLSDGMEIGRVDFGTVGDCPRCLAQIGPDRFLVGTSSWLIYEMQILPAGKSKAGKGSPKE